MRGPEAPISERNYQRLRGWFTRHGFNLCRGRDQEELVAERGTMKITSKNVVQLINTVAQLAEVR